MTVQVWQSNLTGEKIYTVCEIESPYYTYIGTEEWPDPPEPGGGGESTIAWRPNVSADGTITWTRTSSTATPTPVNVKGEKGDTGATGEKGDTGAKGADGAKGDKGDDGYSPTITVTEITGGHRVTVTDASGSDSFDVMDGNEKASFITDGDWRYKINADNTFEAYYSKSGVTIEIQNGSGAFFRSAQMTLILPSGITNDYDATPLHASVMTSHNNYPCLGALASVATNQINYFALSGSTRNVNPNYIVTAHVFGTLAAKA